MKKIMTLLCALFCATVSFETKGDAYTTYLVAKSATDAYSEYKKAHAHDYDHFWVNLTDKPITFRIVTEGRGCTSYSPMTLKPGDQPININVGCPYHIEIELSWGENKKYWGDLHKLGPDMPADDYQNPNSTYWGVGSWTEWGWKFGSNPRGAFRMKGPSVQWKNFKDSNSYLTLSE